MKKKILTLITICLILVCFSINVFSANEVSQNEIIDGETNSEATNKTLFEQKTEVDNKLNEIQDLNMYKVRFQLQCRRCKN